MVHHFLVVPVKGTLLIVSLLSFFTFVQGKLHQSFFVIASSYDRICKGKSMLFKRGKEKNGIFFGTGE